MYNTKKLKLMKYKLSFIILIFVCFCTFSIIYAQQVKNINNNIMEIDFKNYTYPPFQDVFWDEIWLFQKCSYMYENTVNPVSILEFTLKKGKFKHPENDINDPTIPKASELILSDVYYSDFNKDNILDALVEIEYSTISASYKYQYIAYLFTINDSNKVVLLDKFSGIPTDKSVFKNGSTNIRFNVQVRDNTIFVSDDFGGPRYRPEYKVTFIGEYLDNRLHWNYIIEKIR